MNALNKCSSLLANLESLGPRLIFRYVCLTNIMMIFNYTFISVITLFLMLYHPAHSRTWRDRYDSPYHRSRRTDDINLQDFNSDRTVFTRDVTWSKQNPRNWPEDWQRSTYQVNPNPIEHVFSNVDPESIKILTSNAHLIRIRPYMLWEKEDKKNV